MSILLFYYLSIYLGLYFASCGPQINITLKLLQELSHHNKLPKIHKKNVEQFYIKFFAPIIRVIYILNKKNFVSI